MCTASCANYSSSSSAQKTGLDLDYPYRQQFRTKGQYIRLSILLASHLVGACREGASCVNEDARPTDPSPRSSFRCSASHRFRITPGETAESSPGYCMIKPLSVSERLSAARCEARIWREPQALKLCVSFGVSARCPAFCADRQQLNEPAE